MDEISKHDRAEGHHRYGMARMQFEQQQLEPLLRLGRALADPMRIRILALLAEKAMHGQELAEALKVSPPTISHHLALLRGAGLVYSQRENSYQYYKLVPEGLQQAAAALTTDYIRGINKQSASLDEPLAPTDNVDSKLVQEAFFKDGRLLALSGSSRANRFIMEKVVEAFAWDCIYNEGEVNDILGRMYDDPATLRRALIDDKLMARKNGSYWRVKHEEQQ